jgi:hypothetical protein
LSSNSTVTDITIWQSYLTSGTNIYFAPSVGAPKNQDDLVIAKSPIQSRIDDEYAATHASNSPTFAVPVRAIPVKRVEKLAGRENDALTIVK